jgi:hypothetical protein
LGNLKASSHPNFLPENNHRWPCRHFGITAPPNPGFIGAEEEKCVLEGITQTDLLKPMSAFWQRVNTVLYDDLSVMHTVEFEVAGNGSASLIACCLVLAFSISALFAQAGLFFDSIRHSGDRSTGVADFHSPRFRVPI